MQGISFRSNRNRIFLAVDCMRELLRSCEVKSTI
jgi:hypothetical protein